MKSYIEINYLLTMMLMLMISIIPKYSNIKHKTKQTFICCICTFLAFISQYPFLYIITYFLLTTYPSYITTLHCTIIYIIFIELLTTLLPFTHTQYLLQAPAHLSLPLLSIISLFFVILPILCCHSPTLTNYSQVSLHIPHHIITGLGYKDSGNVVLVDQRPLLFLKYEPLLVNDFTSSQQVQVNTIEGEHTVSCIMADVYVDHQYKGECYVAMVHFDEVYDVILNGRI